METNKIENTSLFKISYGLYVLTSRLDGKDNGCIINCAMQISDSPKTVAVSVNKKNLTHDMILLSDHFTLSVISQSASFDLFKRFGFASGRDTKKFEGFSSTLRTDNGVIAITEGTNAYISAKVIKCVDCGTHTIFIGEVTEAKVLSGEKSATYEYYFEHIKPKTPPKEDKKKTAYVCKICGYVYEGEELPEDFVCPICKHGASDFEKA